VAEHMEQSQPLLTRIESWLVAYLANRVGVDPVDFDTHQTFRHCGLASIEALNLVRELENWLGCSLSPTVAWNHPTVADLAQYLASDVDILRQARIAASYSQESLSHATSGEAIAIVGMGCRLPGAPNPESFWQLLCDGRDAITEVPADRWDVKRLFDPDPSRPGTMVSRWGGFLERIDKFDAQFFGISPREAPHLDPRQRLMLEVTWEAIEDAGILCDYLAGSRTGVFVATLSADYGDMLFRDLNRVDAYSGPGMANSVVSNRISYFFDLRGPSLTLDTACSGSLVAIHLACQSLRSGECALALAGGVSVNLLPNGNVFFSKAGILSPTGRCKPFDSRADGIVRSEGAGVVVLKLLSQAQEDGDRIYAVIRGSAVNQDGRSNGLMAPNGLAQEAVLRKAYEMAGISPALVQYIETHGTGTQLGDPIEVEALNAVLGSGHSRERPCVLGSLKSNMGHLEPAAGVAGVIKTALAMKHRLLPPNLHFQESNPLIPFGDLPFVLKETTGPWPVVSEPLVAGVSSFGFGGTNAHVVLTEAPQPAVTSEEGSTATGSQVCLLPLSARSSQALVDLADAYRQFLVAQTEQEWRDICYTAGARRAHHREHRLALAACSPEEAAEHLAAFLRGEMSGRLVVDNPPTRPSPIVFVFSGQGSHWARMGCELFEQEPVFRAALEECDRLLRQHTTWSLLEELGKGEIESRLSETDRAQPAIFALQVALAALWYSWGVEPDVVVGQSLGEVAAAHVSGALTLEDAIRVAVHRGRLMKRVEGHGKTALVGLPLEQARLILEGHDDAVGIGGSSSPDATVLSGDPDVLKEILSSLEEQGVFCRLLRGVDLAFHSPQMEPLQGELVEVLADITPRPATVPIYSTVIGDVIAGEELDAVYWGRNLREPFLFACVIQGLVKGGHESFLEISPHPVLNRAIQDNLRHLDQEGHVWASLRRNEPQRETMLASLGALYAAGHVVNWSRLYPEIGKVVSLPTYPWQRERYWFDQLDGEQASSPNFVDSKSHGHPLLGAHVQLACVPSQHVWEMSLNAHTTHYLKDHRVRSMVVLPGAAYAEIALAAALQAFPGEPCSLADVTFEQPLVLPETGWRQVQLIVSPHASGEATFRFASRSANASDKWALHATGKIYHGANERREEESPLAQSPDAVRSRCQEEMPVSAHYQAMAAQGLQYGETFQAVAQIWRQDGEALVRLLVPESLTSELTLYHIHPALLDAGFQAVATASPAGQGAQEMYLPVGIDRLQVHARADGELWCHVRLRSGALSEDAGHAADICFLDQDGQLVAVVEGLRLQCVAEAATGRRQEPKHWLYSVGWHSQDVPALPPEAEVGNWLVFADQGGLGEVLAAEVEALGGTCDLVFAGPHAADNVAVQSSQIHTILPDEPAAFQRLLARIRQGSQACQGIIYLWGLDLPTPDAVSADAFFADVYTKGCRPVLYLVQALVREKWVKMPRLWLVTRGVQVAGVTGDAAPATIAQAPLWGMGRVIAQEYPEVCGGLVDLASSRTTEHVSGLLEICRHSGDEDAFIIHDGHRYTARLERRTELIEDHIPVLLRADASYLVTGGFGGLGLRVAQWLVEQGARRLILMGRTPLPPRSSWDSVADGTSMAERIATVRRLEKMGATVYSAAVDVADTRQLTDFLAAYDQAGWPPIRGVVHAAGVIQDQFLVNMTPDTLESVLRPKVLGAWLLHCLLADAPLDFFVLFSSATAILGQLGQASYAAGNAFMDALAHYRRSQGLPALSINWGVWAEVGMAARSNSREQFERMGMYAFAPDQALSLMGQLLSCDTAQVAVINADWGKLQHASSARASLLAQLAQESVRQAGGDSCALRDDAAAQLLLVTDPAERQSNLEAYLRGLAAQTFRLADLARLPTNQSLTMLGMDSIMAVELKNRVEANLPVTLSIADLVMGVSVAELADKLNTQLELDEEIAALLDEVEGISVEEAKALLDGPPVS
jgi:acyl transferase domain-containing protein/acyl carrier protein